MKELVFGRLPCSGPITGGFGDWYPGPPAYQHRGIDLGVPDGTPVYAPAAGRSVRFTNDGSFGSHAACLEHEGTGLFSLYAHLESAAVSVGDEVGEGELLGHSGHEGKVTGPHLHWQVCIDTRFAVDIRYSRNPLDYLIGEDEMKAIEDLQRRMDAIEAIVVENGFDGICRPGMEELFAAEPNLREVLADGTLQPVSVAVVTPEGESGPRYRLTGDRASEYAARRGFSLGLAVEQVQGR